MIKTKVALLEGRLLFI